MDIKVAFFCGVLTLLPTSLLGDEMRAMDALQEALDDLTVAVEALKRERQRESAISQGNTQAPPTARRTLAPRLAPASGRQSSSEADGLRLAIQQCWNVGVLSTDAQQVTVTVAFSMTPSARHKQGTIRIVSASGGTETAIQQAFDAARRAIIRCEGDGYGLPADKYDAWREIQITFNPEGMRLR